MAAIWRAYMRVLEKYPMRTLAIGTGTLMFTGDGIAQMVIEKKGKNYELVRGMRFFTFGLCIGGPWLRGWYLLLDRAFGKTKFAALKMVIADQTIFAPSFLFTFVTVMAAMRGESLEGIKEKIKRDYIPIMKANYTVWPAVQTVNFYFVPFQHRVMFVNFVALWWNTYLAWRSETFNKKS